MAANSNDGFAILEFMGYSHPGWQLCRNCKNWSRYVSCDEPEGQCDAPVSVGLPPVNTEDCGSCHAFEAKEDDE